MVTDELSRAVPYEVRDFAERSMDQAQKAFDGFIGVVNAVIEDETPQAAESQGEIAQEPASAANLSRLAVDFAERNVQGAFELARNMMHARDLTQVLELQRDFLEAQMKSLKSQMRSLEKASAPGPQASRSQSTPSR
jgi:hypothetical protein